MMTSSSASVCASSRSRARSASVPPVERWASTTRPTTAGSRRSSAGLGGAQGQGAAPAKDAERARPAPRAADHRLRPRPSRPGTKADRRRAAPREVGRPRHLAQRRLAGATPPRPQHAHSATLTRGRLSGALRALTAALPAAARGGLTPGSARRARLLLRRPPVRDEGRSLAVHGDRRCFLVRLGRAARHAQESCRRALPLATASPPWTSSRRRSRSRPSACRGCRSAGPQSVASPIPETPATPGKVCPKAVPPIGSRRCSPPRRCLTSASGSTGRSTRSSPTTSSSSGACCRAFTRERRSSRRSSASCRDDRANRLRRRQRAGHARVLLEDAPVRKLARAAQQAS
jgi:hypothetical protein